MARTPTDTQVEQFTDASQENQALEEIRTENNAVAAADAVIMGSFDVIKAIGRIEAAQFMETVSEKLIIETALKVRETKEYKGLPFITPEGKSGNISTFDEFCEIFLGKTGRRIRDLISNYNQLGPDLYEQAEKIGFRQKDYNALKALPADDRQLIAQAIESESLDSALDLMQQLAAKHQREKAALEAETAELKKSIASKDAVIQNRGEKISELEQDLERQRLDRPQGAHVNWPEAFRNGYFQQLAITRKNIKHAIGSLDLIREDAMKIEAGSEAEEAALNQAREILAAELVGIHNECADMLEALGMSFDRSLGAFCDARIRWLAQS
jgi:DNA-binding MltR family transcriptional regulator